MKEMNVSDFLNEYAGEGLENITARDLSVPFVKILQGLSPEIVEKTVPGAEPGMFYNTITKTLYGTKIQIIPLRYELLWIEYRPNRGSYVAAHKPGSIAIEKATNDKGSIIWLTADRNEIIETLVFCCLSLNHLDEGIFFLSLSKTHLKYGKKLNTYIAMTKLDNGEQAPYFSSVWELSTVLNKNDSGVWYTLGTKAAANITRIRFITLDEFNNHVLPAKNFAKNLSSTSSDFKQIEDERLIENEDTPF